MPPDPDVRRRPLVPFYDDYSAIEEELQAALRESLDPRGPEHFHDVIADLGLPEAAVVVDVGCGEGRHSLELARRFGFTVHGLDPVEGQLAVAVEALAAADDAVRAQVTFTPGSAEAIPLEDDTVDLVYCREVLYHVEDLVAAFVECRRVLKPDGRLAIYQLFSTDRLEPREADWFWGVLLGHPSSADRSQMEAAFAAAGLDVVDDIELGSETGEWSEEQHGKVAQEALAAARLLRQPERYIERLGQAAYDIKLADAFWHVYRMIGKLSNRIYVLRA